MDRIIERLTDYGTSLTFAKLGPDTVHHVKRHLIDTLGCGIGSYRMMPPTIARAHALEVSSSPGATVLGTAHRSSAELAAFANGVMARYLDFNDTSMSPKTGHPSDNIMPVLAAAEYAGADMPTIITSIVFAYEVQDQLGSAGFATHLHDHGWDHVVAVAISAAAGASLALGLDNERMTHALGLAATSNIVTRRTRTGQLSMWKGCAAGNASRNGVFAVLLARRGLTGPSEAFEGSKGLFQQLGVKLTLPPFGGEGVLFSIAVDKFKNFPCDYEAQCSITPAIALHDQLGERVRQIEAIDIETYYHAIEVAADTLDKWEPETRETADHSIPYVVAVGLIKGNVWFEDFTDEAIRRPDVRGLMRKIKIRSSKECDSIWPDAYPFRITVTLRSGERFFSEVRYAKGHPKNPMTDQDLEAKFRRLTEPEMGEAKVNKALTALWQLEKMKGARDIFELFAFDRGENPP